MNHAIHTAVRRARHARIATSTALAGLLVTSAGFWLMARGAAKRG